MNIVNIPLLATPKTVLESAVIYIYHKYNDRKSAFSELRRKSYRDFANANYSRSGNPERIQLMTRAIRDDCFQTTNPNKEDVSALVPIA